MFRELSNNVKELAIIGPWLDDARPIFDIRSAINTAVKVNSSKRQLSDPIPPPPHNPTCVLGTGHVLHNPVQTPDALGAKDCFQPTSI